MTRRRGRAGVGVVDERAAAMTLDQRQLGAVPGRPISRCERCRDDRHESKAGVVLAAPLRGVACSATLTIDWLSTGCPSTMAGLLIHCRRLLASRRCSRGDSCAEGCTSVTLPSEFTWTNTGITRMTKSSCARAPGRVAAGHLPFAARLHRLALPAPCAGRTIPASPSAQAVPTVMNECRATRARCHCRGHRPVGHFFRRRTPSNLSKRANPKPPA